MRDVDIVRRIPWGGAEFIKQKQLTNKNTSGTMVIKIWAASAFRKCSAHCRGHLCIFYDRFAPPGQITKYHATRSRSRGKFVTVSDMAALLDTWQRHLLPYL